MQSGKRSAIIAEKLLLAKYELNHSSAVPQMPVQRSRRVRRAAWSTVSNAAVRSRSTNTAGFPASTHKVTSLWNLTNAEAEL